MFKKYPKVKFYKKSFEIMRQAFLSDLSENFTERRLWTAASVPFLLKKLKFDGELS